MPAEIQGFTDLLSATPRHGATLLVVPCKFILSVEIEHAPEDQNSVWLQDPGMIIGQMASVDRCFPHRLPFLFTPL